MRLLVSKKPEVHIYLFQLQLNMVSDILCLKTPVGAVF